MKKNNMKRALVAVLLLLMAITFVGCGNRDSALVGRWEMSDGSWTLEFFSDGTLAIEERWERATGTWSTEGDRLILSGSRVGRALIGTWTFHISGDTLTLSESGRPTQTYTRIR